MNCRKFAPVVFCIFVLGKCAFAQFEPLTEGMISWEDYTDFQIGKMIPVCEGMENEYPAVAVDRNGVVWVVWIRDSVAGDQVFLRGYSNGAWQPEIAVSEAGAAYVPVIACDQDNRLHLVWTFKRGDVWQLEYATWHDGSLTKPITLSSGAASDRNPSLCVTHDGAVWLAWETDRRGNRDVCVGQLKPEGLSDIVQLNADNADNCAPCLAASPSDALAVVWHRFQGDGNFDVFFRERQKGHWQPEVRITDSPAVDAFPSVAADSKGRFWIAWHSNRLEEGSGITNWIYVRCWDGKNLYETVNPMPGVNLEKDTTDQGFEFPTIHVDTRDRVWLFGRPSHNFCVQVYAGDSWSDMIRLPIDGWGGRGQMVRVAEDPAGRLWLARRDIRQNTLQEISGLDKEAPPLKLKRAERVVDSSVKATLPGNPSERYSLGDYSLYFGDIHAHTWTSDGMGSPDEFWTRCRDTLGWDFAALTDHDDFVGNRISSAEWEEMKYIANRYDQPGQFVAIQAYEWTTARPPVGFGHKNVYFADADPPLFRKCDPDAASALQLYEKIRPWKALAFPHHIAWTGSDWDNLDPEISTCVEIISNHGRFEFMGNLPIRHRGGRVGEFVQDGLAQGLRFGIIGGSDTHGLRWQHGVSYKADCYRTGVTGVYASELTREGVIEALRSRRCIATTGVPITVAFQADGHIMGQEYETDVPPKFEVEIKGTSLIQYVTLIRNNEEIYHNGGDSTDARFTYVDEAIEPGISYYYIRVLQRDNEMAWSSPIWVNYAP